MAAYTVSITLPSGVGLHIKTGFYLFPGRLQNHLAGIRVNHEAFHELGKLYRQ